MFESFFERFKPKCYECKSTNVYSEYMKSCWRQICKDCKYAYTHCGESNYYLFDDSGYGHAACCYDCKSTFIVPYNRD